MWCQTFQKPCFSSRKFSRSKTAKYLLGCHFTEVFIMYYFSDKIKKTYYCFSAAIAGIFIKLFKPMKPQKY